MKAAVYGATRNVYGDTIPAIKSLMMNSDVDEIYLMTEDDSIAPYKLPKNVTILNVSGQKWFRPDGVNYTQQWSWMTLMRIALPFLFQDLDKIVWFDNDTIVHNDVSELWDIDLGDCYVGGVEEPHHTKQTRHMYINAGVLYFNLKRLRESGKAAEMIDVLHRQKFPFPDQDVINCLCQGYMKGLPLKYNVYDWTGSTDDECVRHFAGWKTASDKNWSWNTFPLVNKYRNIPMDEVVATWERNRNKTETANDDTVAGPVKKTQKKKRIKVED